MLTEHTILFVRHNTEQEYLTMVLGMLHMALYNKKICTQNIEHRSSSPCLGSFIRHYLTIKSDNRTLTTVCYSQC